MKKTKIIAEFTNFPNTTNWVEGMCDKYSFCAKLFDTGSSFGINDGRVSKLWIADPTNNNMCVTNYDRGWDVRPLRNVKPYYNAIMELLENSPKRFT